MKIIVVVKISILRHLAVNLNASSPRSACRELALSIVEDLPASLIDEETLPQASFILSLQPNLTLISIFRCAIY